MPHTKSSSKSSSSRDQPREDDNIDLSGRHDVKTTTYRKDNQCASCGNRFPRHTKIDLSFGSDSQQVEWIMDALDQTYGPINTKYYFRETASPMYGNMRTYTLCADHLDLNWDHILLKVVENVGKHDEAGAINFIDQMKKDGHLKGHHSDGYHNHHR